MKLLALKEARTGVEPIRELQIVWQISGDNKGAGMNEAELKKEIDLGKEIELQVGEYVRGKAHTNGIESFWSLLKRGYIGTFHYMSPKHLQKYVNEFASRQSMRRCDTIDAMAITTKAGVGKSLS